MVYDNDARNIRFEVGLKCSNGVEEREVVMRVGKEMMGKMWEQMELIQDEINSYM